jgi:hypothetical protein
MIFRDVCGEVWRKSTFCGGAGGGDCVEVALLDGGGVAVRDSKDRAGAVLVFTGTEWVAFLAGAGVRAGEFDPA